MHIQSIVPCLWFDNEAEEAADFYVSLFDNSRIVRIMHFGEAGHEIHGKTPGSVMTVVFTLGGREFTALNGGPEFKFNEAISLQILCDTQDEIDHFWSRLIADDEEGVCGWLKDKYGLSWQVVPTVLLTMLADPDRKTTDRVTNAFLQMKKFDIAALERAYAGA